MPLLVAKNLKEDPEVKRQHLTEGTKMKDVTVQSIWQLFSLADKDLLALT